MRVSDKLALIDKIGRELQSRFTFEDIDTFLAEYQIEPPIGNTWNSKWVYSKAALSGVPEEIIVKIAAELDMPVAGVAGALLEPPRNWQGTKALRLFISHISKEKLKATRLKDCLAPFGVAGFVAHEDIHPTLEWQSEIERALHTMDAFVAMHTPGFSQSFWTQQEIGFAVGKGVKIISLRMGEDPTGFISKQQALPRGTKTAEEIAVEIDRLLAEDRRTKERLAEAKAALQLSIDIPF
jgi:hypothetical protein